MGYRYAWRLAIAVMCGLGLSALPAGERDLEARRLAREEAWRPFDLARGPLLRSLLLTLAPADHALLLVLRLALERSVDGIDERPRLGGLDRAELVPGHAGSVTAALALCSDARGGGQLRQRAADEP